MKAIQIFNTLCSEGKTVGCVFTNTNYAQGHEKVYTYRIPDELDVEVGDLAVVEKDGKYSFVTIVEIHETSQIDTEVTYRYKWIVIVIKTKEYMDKMEEEDKALKEIKNSKTTTERETSKVAAKSYVSDEVANKVSRL